MPSGAKKRKAAKKKKEKGSETNTNLSSTNPLGNDELKSHEDGKGSDGGEGSSPAYGDHDHSFNEEEDERDPSDAQLSDAAAASKDIEEVSGDAKIDETEASKDGVVVIEWDMKSEEGSESKGVSVVPIESAKQSDHGIGNSSSSNGVKSLESLHAKVTSVTQNVPGKESGDSVAESSADPVKEVASVPEVQSNDTVSDLLEKPLSSQVETTDLAVRKIEDREYPLADQNVRTSSVQETKPKEFDNEVSASVSNSPIPESTISAEQVKDSDTPESSQNQPTVVSAPHVVQKTSWLSCCGLFEALSGSNR